MTNGKERLSLKDALVLIRDVLTANGVSEGVANSVAKALVAAEAEGQVGHGFSRLADYVAQVRTGKINPNAQLRTRRSGATAVLTDADCGFAFPALEDCMSVGAEVAATQGLSAMSVYNSHHCGTLSYHVEKMAEEGLICFMFANAPKAIAPWGSTKPVFGTNPIAFAAPRKDGPPLVIDMSLSKVARGKVMNAKKSGTSIPKGWALDEEGTPTTDPEAALNGSMLPMGDAKGTALAMMVEILTTCFAGGAFSSDAGSFFSGDGPAPRVGQFLMAISPQSSSYFFARLELLLSSVASLEGARLPGERRLQARAEAEENGILVPSHYLEAAESLRHL